MEIASLFIEVRGPGHLESALGQLQGVELTRDEINKLAGNTRKQNRK